MRESPPLHASVTPVALNHVHLTSEDPEREIRFLTEILGFRRDPSHRSFVWLGPMQLAVTKGEPIRSERFHLGFRMDTTAAVDALREHLRARGVESSEPSSTGSYYSCYFETPTGYSIEAYAEGGIPALGTID